METREEDLVRALAGEIDRLAGDDPAGHAREIEELLARSLAHLDDGRRIALLERLERSFCAPEARPVGAGQALGAPTKDVVGLIVGRDVDVVSLAPEEILERLSDALQRVFAELNEIVGLIETTLGGAGGLDETIRGIVGAEISGGTPGATIEDFLGRIRKAFLISKNASQEAARTVAGHIIKELDPASVQAETSGLAIGPLRKAQAFEAFEERYARVRKWFDSERFMLDFSRQFEKNCRKAFTGKGGEA